MAEQPRESRLAEERSRRGKQPPVPQGGFPKLTPAQALGIALVFVYLLRNSAAGVVIPGVESACSLISYLLLGISALFIVSAGLKLAVPAALLILLCLPGSLASTGAATTIPKYCGWALLVLAVGPLVMGGKARQLRQGAWSALVLLTGAIGVASFIWYALRLPVFGVGAFTGVMNHANTVGPLAALGVILASCRALAATGRSGRIWWLVSGISLIPCTASGSRIAAISLLVGLIAVGAVEWKRVSKHLLLVLSLGVFLLAGGYVVLLKSDVISSMTETLREKKDINTREQLWHARMEEFRANPWLGIGIGYADISSAVEFGSFEGIQGVGIDTNGKMSVEPGSSYLALLSMTGLAGATGMTVLLFWIGRRFAQRYGALPISQVSQLAGVGGFLAVHAIAEGWLLAVGSPLCLIFWLWLGRMMDATTRPTSGSRRPKLRKRVKSKIQAASQAGEPASAAASPLLVPEA